MRWLLLLITLSLNLTMYAPAYLKFKINLKTLNELKIIKLKAERLKLEQAADSVAFSILDKYKRKKTDKQHKAFINKMKVICDSLEIPLSWLVSVMYHESRLNHKALNSIRAVGLIQFLPSTARGLGTTTNALYNMTDVKQLDYVYKFYKRIKGKLKYPTDLHLYAFFPIAVLNKWKDSHVIQYGKLSAYTIAKHNRGLDLNKDHKITVKEFRAVITKRCPLKLLNLST